MNSKIQWMRKIFVVACVAALMGSMVACQKETKTGGTTESTAVQETVASTESATGGATVQPGPTPTQAETTKKEAEAATKSNGATEAFTGTKEQVLNLYRTGLKNTSGLARVKYNRTLASGQIWSPKFQGGQKFDLKELDKNSVFTGSDGSKASAGLPALESSWVESASVKESNGKRVLTIRLKSKSSGTDLKKGDGGYAELVDFNQVKTLVDAFGRSMNLKNVKTQEMKSSLSNGVYTVTMAKDQDKIEKISLSFSQSVNADLKYLVFNVKGSVQFTMNAEYSK